MAQGSFKKFMVAFFAGIFLVLALGAGALFWQRSYFYSFLHPQPADSQPVQAVVVFQGDDDYSRLDKGVAEANRKGAAYFIVSSGVTDDIRFEILKVGGLPKAQVWVNQQTTTTDGDARYAAELLKKLKVQKAVLITSWFHLPRSAFLLRLYLANTGIQVQPINSDDPPADARDERIFQMEMVKFWGSLGRAALFALHGISQSVPQSNP
ncbi:MAG TPA: YdcF family protein [bacterium]|nr:YdcF family protein [bacterium]